MMLTIKNCGVTGLLVIFILGLGMPEAGEASTRFPAPGTQRPLTCAAPALLLEASPLCNSLNTQDQAFNQASTVSPVPYILHIASKSLASVITERLSQI